MPTYAYHLLDVFTDQPFGGNQLAVFPDAAGMPAEIMQRIARELNLAETTFVLPPCSAESDFHVRIFTPAVEMPMAGHPTVGTADVLYRLGRFSGDRVRFEEGVGVIPVEITGEPTRPLIWMDQPEPVLGPRFEDRGEKSKLRISLILLGKRSEKSRLAEKGQVYQWIRPHTGIRSDP